MRGVSQARCRLNGRLADLRRLAEPVLWITNLLIGILPASPPPTLIHNLDRPATPHSIASSVKLVHLRRLITVLKIFQLTPHLFACFS